MSIMNRKQIALFVVAMVAAVGVYCGQRRKSPQRKAFADIEKLDGRVEFDTTRPDKPVIEVYLAGRQVNDAALAHLKGLTKLEELYLHNAQVSDRGLVHLRGLINLERLGLYNTLISEAGVETIGQALPECQIRL